MPRYKKPYILNNFRVFDLNADKILTNKTLIENVDKLITLSRKHTSAYTKITKEISKLMAHYYKYDANDEKLAELERKARQKESTALQINNENDHNVSMITSDMWNDVLDKEERKPEKIEEVKEKYIEITEAEEESELSDKEKELIAKMSKARNKWKERAQELQQDTPKQPIKKQKPKKTQYKRKSAAELIKSYKKKFPNDLSFKQIKITPSKYKGVFVLPMCATVHRQLHESIALALRKKGIYYKTSRCHPKVIGKPFYVLKCEDNTENKNIIDGYSEKFYAKNRKI